MDQLSEQKESHTSGGGAYAFFRETIKVVLISLIIIVPIRYYLIQPFFVKGQSMESNFQNKDYIIVDKLGYRFNRPLRGDVIVFKYPINPKDHFIKRIIGLPEETVEIKNNNIIIYNDHFPEGFVLEEDIYLDDFQRTKGSLRKKLGEDEYFVIGDNRMHSSDSRVWGPLHKSFISGRAWIRLWPLDKIIEVPRVTYSMPELP
jgi:signal peptidase I